MRISSLLPLLTLVACGQGKQDAARADEQRRVDAAPKFFCAQGQGELVAQCTIERQPTATGVVLTLRHPDGHFRRLLVAKDGRGVTAADGAQVATVTPTGADQINVAIGVDRYRLPATIGR